VPVKVSLANGPIAVGDRLTVSSTSPGVAVKLVGAGSYLGEALAPYTATSTGGTVVAIIDRGVTYGALSLDATTASTTASTFSTSTLAAAFQSFGATISNGFASFAHLVAAQFTVGSSEKPSGITLYDDATGSPYCVRVHDGKLVNTPGACADTTATSTSASGPTITILGDNPMHLSVGAPFADPGVTVSDPVDGTDPVTTFINGTQQEVSSTTISTASPTTYIITYKALDSAGNTSTATRSVIVGNPDGTVSTGATSTTSGQATSSPQAGTASTSTTTPATTAASTTDAASPTSSGQATSSPQAGTASTDTSASTTPATSAGAASSTPTIDPTPSATASTTATSTTP
jgi:hypothetical protein